MTVDHLVAIPALLAAGLLFLRAHRRDLERRRGRQFLEHCRRFAAGLDNLQIALGTELLPSVMKAAKDFAELAAAFRAVQTTAADFDRAIRNAHGTDRP